jgi:hypothetical protein
MARRLAPLLLLLLALPAAHAPAPLGAVGEPPPLVAWVRVDGSTLSCAGAGIGQVAEEGATCHVLCVTESYCAVFVRDPQLRYVPFTMTYQDLLGRWLTADARDYGGYLCIGIADLRQPVLNVTPLSEPGSMGVANAQDDDGLYC